MKQFAVGKCLALVVVAVMLAGPAMAQQGRLTLDQAVAKALADNRLIRAARETSRAAVSAVDSAKSDFFPEFSATYRYTSLTDTPFMYFQKAVVVPPGLTVGSQQIEAPTGTRDNYHWNLQLAQPLFTGFALTTRYKMAQTGVARKTVELAQARLDVARQVRLACIQVLAARRRLAVAEEAVVSIGAHVQDAEKFHREGLIPFNDLLQSRVALADARQQEAEIRGQVGSAVAALNTLIGADIDRDTQVEEIGETPGALPKMADLREEARNNRPELKSLDLALKQLDQALTLNRSVYYPQLALVGQFYQEGDNFDGTRNAFRNDHNASMTLQAQWRFSIGGKTRAEAARLRHEKQALAENRKGVGESIDLEVTDARIRLGVAAENIETAQKALEQSKENLRITNLRYQEQIATSTDVLDATAANTLAKSNYYGALYGYQAALAELDRAVGRPVTTPGKG